MKCIGVKDGTPTPSYYDGNNFVTMVINTEYPFPNNWDKVQFRVDGAGTGQFVVL